MSSFEDVIGSLPEGGTAWVEAMANQGASLIGARRSEVPSGALDFKAHVLDPNQTMHKSNRIGVLTAGQSARVYASGQWRAGNPGHDWLGPTGLNGMWHLVVAALHVDLARNQQWTTIHRYVEESVTIPSAFAPQTFLFAYMWDDLYGDNENHPGDPMRVDVSL
jgi:hypothetical protein